MRKQFFLLKKLLPVKKSKAMSPKTGVLFAKKVQSNYFCKILSVQCNCKKVSFKVCQSPTQADAHNY